MIFLDIHRSGFLLNASFRHPLLSSITSIWLIRRFYVVFIPWRELVDARRLVALPVARLAVLLERRVARLSLVGILASLLSFRWATRIVLVVPLRDLRQVLAVGCHTFLPRDIIIIITLTSFILSQLFFFGVVPLQVSQDHSGAHQLRRINNGSLLAIWAIDCKLFQLLPDSLVSLQPPISHLFVFLDIRLLCTFFLKLLEDNWEATLQDVLSVFQLPLR